MIDSVIAYLSQEQGMTAKEIADLLWLAVVRQQFTGKAPSNDNPTPAPPSPPSPSPKSRHIDGSDRPPAPLVRPVPPVSSTPVAGLFPRGATSDAIAEMGGLPFKVPNAPSIREPLTLARALRPLIRRVPSAADVVLDEAATAQRIAEEQTWVPVTKPVLEPWLDLVLVVDESPSMLVWRRTVLELWQLLRNHGAFRDVRLWSLGIARSKVYLHPGMGTRANQTHRTPQELVDPSGRRLVLVVTDCVSPIWQTRSLLDALAVWAEQGLMAIAQVLPEWLWTRTALRQASAVKFHSLEPGTLNQQLSVIRRASRREGNPSQPEIYVPILTLEPEMVLTWSQMVAGKGNVQAPGFVFRPDLQPTFEKFRQRREEIALSPEQQVHRFRLVSSPMARRLAELVAATPIITLPIIRLIQETLLPRSNQVHVAEVLQGGLLKPAVAPAPGVRPDDVEYRFVEEGMRRELLKSAPVPDTVKVLTKYVTTQFGKSLDEFIAELRQWIESNDKARVEQTRPFALVSAEVLRRKGRQYAEFVQEVDGKFGDSITTETRRAIPEPQIFEFEVATIEFDDDSQEAEPFSTEAIAWFSNQSFILEHYYRRSADETDDFFDRWALEMGEYYDELAPFILELKRASSRRDYSFHYALQDRPQAVFSRCVNFIRNLASLSLLSRYHSNEKTRTITGNLQSHERVISLFAGEWFERFVCQKIVHFLQEQGLQYSYLRNLSVQLPDGDRVTLDLFFFVEDKPLLIECKIDGDVAQSVHRLHILCNHFRVPLFQSFVIALELTSEQRQMSDVLLSVVVTDRENFLTHIQAALEAPSAHQSQSVSLETFQFTLAVIEFPAQQILSELDDPQNALQRLEAPLQSVHRDGLFFSHTRSERRDGLIHTYTEFVGQNGLTYTQLAIFIHAWAGQSYGEIAADLKIAAGLNLTTRYVRKQARDLWQLLSQALGQEVRKTTLREVVTQWATAEAPEMEIIRQEWQGRQFVEDLGNGVILEMVAIPGGHFEMGSPESELERSPNESPQHTVTVPAFLMGKYPVTQAQWRAIASLPSVVRELNPDPSRFKGDDRPVEQISWLDALEFCDRLTQFTGRPYRLPSEAEWEYACRANPVAIAGVFRAGDAVGNGTNTPFCFGETITPDLANYNGDYTYGNVPKGIYRGETNPVGSFGVANAFGLFDMHGNVYEWCADHWHENYEGAPEDGSAWLEDENNQNEDAFRLLRGGSWGGAPRYCRSAHRNWDREGSRKYYIGFRVVSSAAWTL